MYKALYRKWRPNCFSDVVGQSHITSTLKNQVKENKTSHAYLFTGSHGTGKTSCAKILAKAVNCQNPINGDPCNVCDICIGIQNQTILDIVEIDAASNNGVDDIRELRDEVIFTPAVAKKKVYIIDEVHMLSSGAWNALLKTLEEPPSHILFILATTEIQKVPQTISSRCQRFDFRRINPSDINLRLAFICKNENILFDEDALNKIAILAGGSLRDALSILEKCIIDNNKITTEIVEVATGGTGKNYVYNFTNMIIENDIAGVVSSINEEYSTSKDLEIFLAELLEHFRNLLISKAVSKPEPLIQATQAEINLINECAKKISLERIMYSIDVITDTISKVQKGTAQKVLTELCGIKLCDAKLSQSLSSINARLAFLETKISGDVQIVASALNQKSDGVNYENVTTKSTTVVNDKTEISDEKKVDYKKKVEPKTTKVTFLPELMENLRNANRSNLVPFLKNCDGEICDDTLFLYTDNYASISTLNNDNNNPALKNAVLSVTGKSLNVVLKEKNVSHSNNDDNNSSLFMELHNDIN